MRKSNLDHFMAPVRAAIQGWTSLSPREQRARLRAASQVVGRLPPTMRGHALELVRPLRASVHPSRYH